VNILIMGASGSGQTTLGEALASKLAFTFLDADDFYWLPTTPAYQEKRDMNSKLSLILSAMESKSVVVAGSIIDWGSALENSFNLVVFLSLDTDIRISRLKVREQQELGFVDDEFIAWATEYENPDFYSRNRVKHLNWLASQQAKVVSIDGDLSVEQRMILVLSAMNKVIE
jgi:uridine kinase